MDRQKRDAIRYLLTDEGLRELRLTLDAQGDRFKFVLALTTKDDLLKILKAFPWTREDLTSLERLVATLRYDTIKNFWPDSFPGRLAVHLHDLSVEHLREGVRRYELRHAYACGQAPTEQQFRRMVAELRRRGEEVDVTRQVRDWHPACNVPCPGHAAPANHTLRLNCTGNFNHLGVHSHPHDGGLCQWGTRCEVRCEVHLVDCGLVGNHSEHRHRATDAYGPHDCSWSETLT